MAQTTDKSAAPAKKKKIYSKLQKLLEEIHEVEMQLKLAEIEAENAQKLAKYGSRNV